MSAIAAVLVHVADVAAGLAWYQRAFPEAELRHVPEQDFTCLRLGDVQLEVVPADAKVAAGAAGTVVYWRVPALAPTLERLLALGATLYRGPMAIEDGLQMCQVRDPWGNCLGLRGP